MKLLEWRKKKGLGQGIKVCTGVTNLFMPLCPARWSNKTNLLLYSIAGREKTPQLSGCASQWCPAKKLISFVVFVSWPVNNFKYVSPTPAAPALLNASDSGTAQLWRCWLQITLLWGPFNGPMEKSLHCVCGVFLLLVLFCFWWGIFVVIQWGREREGSAEIH